ncbi:MAG: dihydropyrimidinase [Defluviitaleaceae bacterium]|nr:dihydropyrimidinase [Defluviitaleaceae bacterium]
MLLKNALLALETGAKKGDLRIKQEIIQEIGEGLIPLPDEETLDLDGKILLPGGVDVHTHMDLDLGNVRATDDFYTGTIAAACGGTTTIVDHMAFGPKGCTIRHQVEAYHKLAGGKAVVDYSFHGVTDHVDDAVVAEMKDLIADGITSHKVYLTYGGKITDYEAMKVMQLAAETGIVIAVHHENDGSIAYLREKHLSQGDTAPIFHARSRPPETEAEAVARTSYFARMAGDAPLYVVHLSSALGLDVVRSARKNGQKNLFVETCPQYLFLDESRYLEPDGLKYIMSPPLRTPDNCDSLWEGIIGGDVDTIGTDHCPFFYNKEKQLGKDDFSKAPGGAPGVEARIPLMFSEISSSRLSLEKMVALCSGNPAKLFGMYPKKGVLAVGSDADLVVVDPNKKVTITKKILHENTDYTPYEGLTLSGWPILTFSRGEIIAKDGEFIGKKGRGLFIKRNLPDLNVR